MPRIALKQSCKVTPRRFYLFAFFTTPDAVGGIGDLYDTYDTKEAAGLAIAGAIKESAGSQFQILDTHTGLIEEFC